MVVAIDSSGLKTGNRGEWRRTCRRSKGHGWIKLHVLVDVRTKQVLSFKVTDENVHDSEMLIPVMKQLENELGPGKVESALGDRGYDSHKNFNYLERRNIQPVLKPRNNANPMKKQPESRSQTAWAILTEGYDAWRNKTNYGLRWMAETFFSTLKRLYGEFLRATTTPGMEREITMKLHFYNKLITYKRPSHNQ